MANQSTYTLRIGDKQRYGYSLLAVKIFKEQDKRKMLVACPPTTAEVMRSVGYLLANDHELCEDVARRFVELQNKGEE